MPRGLWSVSGNGVTKAFCKVWNSVSDCVAGSREPGSALHWVLSASINSVVVLLSRFDPEDRKDGIRLNWNL